MSFRPATLSTFAFVFATVACGGKAKPSSSGAPDTAPSAPIVPLTADGKHLAADGMLACAGPSLPDASLELMGEGSFEFQGPGAAVSGTYELAGDVIRFTPSSVDAWTQLTGLATELPVAADLTTIGSLACRVPGM